LTVLSKPIEGLVDYLSDGYTDDLSKVAKVTCCWIYERLSKS